MKKYCKYCGKELVNNICDCKNFINDSNKNVDKILCDTCGKKIDEDSQFCQFCGMPIVGNELNDKEIFDRKNKVDIFFDKGDIKSILQNVIIKICYIFLMCLVIVLMIYLYPKIKKIVFDYNFRNNSVIEKELEETETEDVRGEIVSEENTTFALRYVNEWVKRNGHFYCFDENGEPVVDDWVKEVDEDGNVSWFYFDEKGQLVVDSWVEGLYYVGIDGRLVTNGVTPDGVRVDENGRVVIEEEEVVMTEESTLIFYNSPGDVVPKETSNQTSKSQGSLKGKINTNADLYLSSLNEYKKKVNDKKINCMIHYYYPVVKGKNASEVNDINDRIKTMFNGGEFYVELQKVAKDKNLKSVLLNKVQAASSLKATLFTFSIYGTVTHQNGQKEDLKYTFRYDRINKVFNYFINDV